MRHCFEHRNTVKLISSGQLITSNQAFTLFRLFPIKQANTVMTILGLTSIRSSGSAYTLAPIFRAIEMAYLKTNGRKKIFVIFCVREARLNGTIKEWLTLRCWACLQDSSLPSSPSQFWWIQEQSYQSDRALGCCCWSICPKGRRYFHYKPICRFAPYRAVLVLKGLKLCRGLNLTGANGCRSPKQPP